MVNVYLFFLSSTPIAPLNYLYRASLEDEPIDEVYIIYNDRILKELGDEEFKKAYEGALKTIVGKDVKVVWTYMGEDDSFENTRRVCDKVFRELVARKERENIRVVVDITPGRKYMSVFLTVVGMRLYKKCSKASIVYVHVLSEVSNAPIVAMPPGSYEIIDLLEVIEKCNQETSVHGWL